MDIFDVESGVCSGIVGQLHPLCLVSESVGAHPGHLVDVVSTRESK